LLLLLAAGLIAAWQAVAPRADAAGLNAADKQANAAPSPGGEAPVQPPLVLTPIPPGPLAGLSPAVLSLYKTVTYTAAVLTTDQLWYMGTAAQAATTGGYFGVVNVVTSPMLTYAFEYAWERCCEAPPGPDGVRPVDARKALIYRAISTARIFALSMAFGNGLGSSLLTTTAIAATRTLVYMTNDFTWNHLTAAGRAGSRPAPPPAQVKLSRVEPDRPATP
jgi:hypothetical protein